jgi:hypothetical protein
MSSTLTQVGSFFGSSGGKAALSGGAAGAGLIQNLLANRQAEQKQKFIENLIQNPAKFSQYVASFEKPLQAGLTADISRQTDAYGAERGLGSSPAIMKDVLAQALAPVYQQQQNQAENTALQSLGIYENSPTQKPMDISGILKALMTGGAPAPVTGTDPGSVPGLGGQSLFDVVGSPSIASTSLPAPMVGDTSDSGASAF